MWSESLCPNSFRSWTWPSPRQEPCISRRRTSREEERPTAPRLRIACDQGLSMWRLLVRSLSGILTEALLDRMGRNAYFSGQANTRPRAGLPSSSCAVTPRRRVWHFGVNAFSTLAQRLQRRGSASDPAESPKHVDLRMPNSCVVCIVEYRSWLDNAEEDEDMDAGRFDDALRRLASARRPFLGAGLSVMFGLASPTLSDAKKKKRKKKKKKTSKCTPNCTEQMCGDDGCGGSCGACATCQSCQNGQCVSKPSFTNCGEGRACIGGQCACVNGRPCNGQCCDICGESLPGNSAFCLPTSCPVGAVEEHGCTTSNDANGACCRCEAGKTPCNGACVPKCQVGQFLNDACECLNQ
jgi:hypothetical protein